MANNQIRMSRNGIKSADGKFDWNDAIIDALIAAGMSFFATLGGLGATGLLDDPVTAILASSIAGGVSFFAWIAMKRGVTVSEK